MLDINEYSLVGEVSPPTVSIDEPKDPIETYNIAQVASPPAKATTPTRQSAMPSLGIFDIDNYSLTSPKVQTTNKTSDYQSRFPEHLLQAELSGRKEIGLKLHGAKMNTIGYGLDLDTNPKAYDYLKDAGVDDERLQRLRDRDTTVRITPEESDKASYKAYQVIEKRIKSLVDRRLGVKFGERSERMQNILVSLGYNGYLTNVSRKNKKRLNEFRHTVWKFARSNDEEGLLDYIKNSPFRNKAVYNRLKRSGFYN